MSGRQYVACVFREGDLRTYTYHHEGEPVAPGDRVIVPGRKEGSQQTVIVSWITDQAPEFPTKAIIGMAPPASDPPAAEPEPSGLGPVPQF